MSMFQHTSIRSIMSAVLLATGLAVTAADEKPAAPAAPAVAVKEAPAAAKCQEAGEDITDEQMALARLRGKLLYKKGQIRKMEQKAVAQHPEAKAQLEEMEQKRRDLYLSLEPALAAAYKDADALEKQVAEKASALPPRKAKK